VIAVIDGSRALRESAVQADSLDPVLVNCGIPLLLAGVLFAVSAASLPLPVQVLLALMLVVPLGPMIYRLAYQPVAEASVLVLLIVSVAVHVTLIGIGLLFFGAEGSRTPAFHRRQLRTRRYAPARANDPGRGRQRGADRRALFLF
jgi:branched-subunit amino acid ABC-type transport system permease component